MSALSRPNGSDAGGSTEPATPEARPRDATRADPTRADPTRAAGTGTDQTGSDVVGESGAASLRDAALSPAAKSLHEILDDLPTQPGVYLMKDSRGRHVYIGKAGNLRSRVRQYFQPSSGDTRLFVPLLEGMVADIETIVTSNEKEALLLENTLIKRHQPRFNVNLRDDKNYLVLRLDPEAEWPRLEVVRKIAADGAYYFGPYHSATSCREALRVVNRHFQLRTCTDHVLHNRRRPCLQYQIKRCPGPCVLPVDRQEYGEQVRDVRLFLEGKDDELVERLTARMKDAAVKTEFERAAGLRDQIRALETTLESQRVVSTEFVDQDVIGYHREGLALEIVVMAIRQGKLVDTRAFSFGGQEFPDSEILSSFVGLFYDSPSASIPEEVLLPIAIEDTALKAEWLTERRQASGRVRGRRRRVEVLVPQRGDRRRLVELAGRNAAVSFNARRNKREDTELMLAKLQKRLRLPRLPRVIECYDISHIQGFAPVASMVVFVDGRPEKSRYRTYRIRGAEVASGGGWRGNDDFASMYEVLSRRLRRAREGEGGWELPDLIVIDGGKGQLAMALAAARDVLGAADSRLPSGAGVPMIGLAKERDEVPQATQPPRATEPPPTEATHTTETTQATQAPEDKSAGRRPDRVYLPNTKDPIPIRPNSAEMFVLQHLRDEAHRFAVGFHRKRRKGLTLRSALADVPGIGPQRQRLLLRHFGSLKKIREASPEELAGVPGMSAKAAAAVFAYLAAASPTLGGASPASTDSIGRQPAEASTELVEEISDGASFDSPQEPLSERLSEPLSDDTSDDNLVDGATEEDAADQDALESAFAAVETDPESET